jgi:hypothetical protein
MITHLFHRKETVDDISLEHQLEMIEQELTRLHPRILSALLLTDKQALQMQESELKTKAQQLRTRIEEQRENTAKTELTNLLKNKLPYILLIANDAEIPISEKLEVALRFSCGHTITIPIACLPDARATNQRLLDTWKALVKNPRNSSLFSTLYCQRCRQDSNKVINGFHVRKDVRVGSCRWTLQILR